METIRTVELFAGVGGFRLGLEAASDKFKVIWANQWEPSMREQYAFECYAAHFGSQKYHVCQDIAKAKINVPDHDLLVGGFPCQDYSVMKKNSAGIEGAKGALWWQIDDILREKRPKYVLLENVDRLIRSPAKQPGRDFSIILYDRSIQVSNTSWISAYDEFSTYFIAFHFRGTCLSLDEFNDLHGFHFEKDPTNFNIDHLISLCEYIENLLMAYQCVPLSYPYGYGNMPTKLINVQFYLQQISQVIEKIGYMQAEQNGLTIFVEKDPAAIAVAESEFIPESLSYRLISYNHYSMKGNLAEKKATLLDLANLLEPQRINLERIDKTFARDLFYAFNNFHIRHNNADPQSPKFKKPIGDLAKEQLEFWYDEVYQMCLLAILRLEHADRKKTFEALKSEIENKTP